VHNLIRKRDGVALLLVGVSICTMAATIIGATL
jgi:hypothetical protein